MAAPQKTSTSNGCASIAPEEAMHVELIYALRCSLLHQGRAWPHGQGVLRMAFLVPSPRAESHRSATLMGVDPVIWLSIPRFVDEVTRGVESWFSEFGTTQTVLRNLAKFVRVRSKGLPPDVVGAPVIA